MVFEAQCNCGAITVKVDDDELFTRPRGHICHCKNCQKTAGSALATNLKIELEKVTIEGQDKLTLYEDPKSLSGNVVKRYFCSICGNPIKSETKPATEAGQVILKIGIWGTIPTPEFEGFTDDRQPFIKPIEGTKGFKKAVGGERSH